MAYQVKGMLLSSMEKVMLNKTPKGGVLPSSILKNERLHFQLAYRLEWWHTTVENTIEIQGDLAPFTQLFVVEHVPVRHSPQNTDDYWLGTQADLYPDILKPFSALDLVLPNDSWRTVWVSVYAEKGLPVGKHTLIFLLRDKDGNALNELSYEVEVLDACYEEDAIVLTNWMHYDCICHKHAVKPFSKGFYSIFGSYLEAYRESGGNMLLTPIFTPPLDTAIGTERDTIQLVDVDIVDGEYVFDFSKLKKFMRFASKHGIRYFEFSHLFTQWGGKACPKIVVRQDGVERKAFGWDVLSTSLEYADFLQVFLTALVAFVESEGVKERCYLHLTDEPRETDTESYAHCASLVKRYCGGMPIMDALSHREFFDQGFVDIPVCYTPQLQTFEGVDRKKLFVYYCGEPTDRYYSNRFINMPALRARVLGVQLYQTGVSGFLHWGFNFYNSYLSKEKIDPFTVTDANYYYPAGDGFIVYPKQGGVYASIRAMMQREAMQDYGALVLLERLAGRAVVDGLLKEFEIKGFSCYPREDDVFVAFRERINALIKGYCV